MLATPAREFRWLAVVAAAPTVLTVALEAAGFWHPSNGHACARWSAARHPGRSRGDERARHARADKPRRMRATPADRTQTTSTIYLICALAWFLPGADTSGSVDARRESCS